jgi:hypothetical protein
MGAWNIVIKGHGIHHNGRDDDANVMARKFAESLKLAGHDVNAATFQLVNGDESPSGAADDLLVEAPPAPQG